MILISQDGRKAINTDKIEFYYIPQGKENDSDGIKYSLYAKLPTLDDTLCQLIRLFRHKDLNIVKNVMKFLANGQFLILHDSDSKNLLVVDLPSLYKHGMKSRDFRSEKRN
ncbi:MAG: hypothetical protein IJQ82_08380 [Selenomonadaceae bacterium]|nr:hypothetical protein [Selenomonadaceae bacterium]